MTALLAALSALAYGSADFAGGYASRKTAVPAVLVWSQLTGLIAALAASPVLGSNRPAVGDVLWGIAAGLAGVAGLAALYRGLASTVAAVISPTAAVTGAVVPVLFGLLVGERPALTAWLGVAVAFPSILALTAEPGTSAERARVRRALALGLAAGSGFGAFFILISRTSGDSGLWPLACARLASIAGVATLAWSRRWTLSVGRGSRPIVVCAGLLDMTANVLFLMAARSGLLVIATVVSSLYPAPTVVLARVIGGERLTLLRTAGLAGAILGVALISLG